MKHILATIGLVVLLAGCTAAQIQQYQEIKKVTCETSLQAWNVYQAAVTNGLPVSPEVQDGARIGAAFLSAYCGWYNPKTRGLTGEPLADTNGVLVVYPPKQ